MHITITPIFIIDTRTEEPPLSDTGNSGRQRNKTPAISEWSGFFIPPYTIVPASSFLTLIHLAA